jgi:hypothetical protein
MQFYEFLGLEESIVRGNLTNKPQCISYVTGTVTGGFNLESIIEDVEFRNPDKFDFFAYGGITRAIRKGGC